MYKNCLIISGGEFCNPDFSLFNDFSNGSSFDLIIACDKGYEYALSLNLKPDFIVGDFDSLDDNLIKQINNEKNVLRFPKRKDDTDTFIAVRKAIELGCTSVSVICAFGNRFDHSFANIQTAIFLAENNVRSYFYGNNEILICIKNSSITIPPVAGFSVSVFSASEKSLGVDICGAEYNINDASLSYSFPLGVSNEFKNENIRVSVKNGTLIIILSKK